MRSKLKLLAPAFLLALSACNSLQPEESSSPQTMQTAKQFSPSKTQTRPLKYLLFLPKDYTAKSSARWPLILFLHGVGERGSDVRKVAIHGPPHYVADHPEFPFILVSPQCPSGERWSNESLLALLDEITRAYAVDPRRIYLTGLSMGGYGAWELGLSYPEKFAALVPICGGGQLVTVMMSSRDKSQALKTLPVWVFHGAKDPVVPLEESQRMVDMLKKIGVKEVKFTIYPETGHNSWTKTYDDPELYEWLLQHERKAKTQ